MKQPLRIIRRSTRLARLLLPLIFVVPPGVAQTHAPAPQDLPSLDKILDRSVAATGGRDAWLKLTSMHFKSEVSVSNPEMTGTLEVYSEAPDKQSECLRLQVGVFFCRAFDGKNGWATAPTKG